MSRSARFARPAPTATSGNSSTGPRHRGRGASPVLADRGEDPEARPERLDDRVGDVAAALAEPLGPPAAAADWASRASASVRRTSPADPTTRPAVKRRRTARRTPPDHGVRPGHRRQRRERASRPRGPRPPAGAIVPVAWSLYDFANTIFSFAVVSYAIGLWLVQDTPFGECDGLLAFSVAVAVSVGINAIVSPILGALSDRAAAGGCRSCCSSRCCASSRRPSSESAPLVGLACSSSRTSRTRPRSSTTTRRSRPVSYPETRGDCRASARHRLLRHDRRRALIFLLDVPVEDRFRRGGPVRLLRDPDLPGRPRADPARHAPPGAATRRRARRPAPGDDRRRARGARPRPLPRRPVLLLRRGQHGHRRDERRRDGGDGPDRPTPTRSCWR